jgi:hypothetical protein
MSEATIMLILAETRAHCTAVFRVAVGVREKIRKLLGTRVKTLSLFHSTYVITFELL